MRLPLLFVTAIFTPVLLLAALLVPSYASIYGACYVVYLPKSGAHPLADKYLDVFTIFDTYQNLVSFWSNSTDLSFVDYTLPIIALPLFGCTLALFITYKLSRRLVNFFHLTASI